MTTGIGHGEAFDAEAEAADHVGAGERTPKQQEYFDAVAEAAERAVDHAQAMIDDLEASMEGRRAEAARARDEAENGRVA
jgi:hypothetical protein